MICTKWLNFFLFVHERLDGEDKLRGPSGTPLYAYRLSDKSYRDLQAVIKEAMPDVLRGRRHLNFEACFCFYAAETFRREHTGGSWAWKTIFDTLPIDVPAQNFLASWVDLGLHYWRREILTGQSGQSLRLVTIACEGGLPLNLIKNEGTNLRTYFRRILESYHGGAQQSNAIEGYAKRHIHSLPKSLRNDEVECLATRLIEQIVELQNSVRDAAEPIAALDALNSNWRDSLPLRVDDELAETLVRNLIKESHGLALKRAGAIEWHGQLENYGAERFRITKSLRFPLQLAAEELSALLALADRPSPRLRLSLKSQGRSEPFAVLTAFNRGIQSIYRTEWLKREGLRLRGNDLVHASQLCLSDGAQEYNLPAQGAADWGASPWIFASTRDGSDWQWVAEGSASVRAPVARVAIDPSCTPLKNEDGTVRLIGQVADLERNLFEITGSATFATDEGDKYVIRCGVELEERSSFSLSGKVFYEADNRRTLFCGVPVFHEFSPDTGWRPGKGVLQWRPFGERAAWYPGDSGCVGKVWLRLYDPSNGIERVKRLVDVLPKNFAVERKVGTSKLQGHYRISGDASARLHVLNPNGEAPVVEQLDGSTVIYCAPLDARAPAALKLNLEWLSASPLTLDLPYPQEGVQFVLDGNPLPRSASIGVDRLYGLWLQIQSPDATSSYRLDAELTSSEALHYQRTPGFIEQLPKPVNGKLELCLAPWAEKLKSLLAASEGNDAEIRLSVLSRTGLLLARIRISQYDMSIEPHPRSQRIQIPTDQISRLGTDWQTRVGFRMVPLWAPERLPVDLEPDAETEGVWCVPDGLEPGPWWIIGRDGRWARFRPLLWSVFGDEEAPTSDEPSLAKAVRAHDPEERSAILMATFEVMCDEPNLQDWEALKGYIRLAAEFPPNSIDPLRHMIKHPRALIMALLKVGDADLHRLWSFANYMPLSWELLPVGMWLSAIENYLVGMRQSLFGLEAADRYVWEAFEHIRQQICELSPYLSSIFDWIQQRHFPERPLKESMLKIVQQLGDEFVKGQLAGLSHDLLGRHASDEPWPEMHGVVSALEKYTLSERNDFKNLPPYQFSVRYAPFLAATIAFGADMKVDPEFIYELRSVREFDTDWFDMAYNWDITQKLALSDQEAFA